MVDFENIENFRKKEINEEWNKIKDEIKKSKKILSCIEIFQVVLLVLSLFLSAASSIIQNNPELITSLSAVAGILNGINIAIKVKNTNEEKRLSGFRQKRKLFEIQLSRAMENGKMDHCDFESLKFSL